jgi:hypothetical protein
MSSRAIDLGNKQVTADPTTLKSNGIASRLRARCICVLCVGSARQGTTNQEWRS